MFWRSLYQSFFVISQKTQTWRKLFLFFGRFLIPFSCLPRLINTDHPQSNQRISTYKDDLYNFMQYSDDCLHLELYGDNMTNVFCNKI